MCLGVDTKQMWIPEEVQHPRGAPARHRGILGSSFPGVLHAASITSGEGEKFTWASC